jgi:hypothetical protein
MFSRNMESECCCTAGTGTSVFNTGAGIYQTSVSPVLLAPGPLLVAPGAYNKRGSTSTGNVERMFVQYRHEKAFTRNESGLLTFIPSKTYEIGPVVHGLISCDPLLKITYTQR